MDNLFDGLQRNMVNVVNNTMGYDAVWVPSAGGPALYARVLLRSPTEKERADMVDYNPRMNFLEYKTGDFPGMEQAMDDKTVEVVIVNGTNYRPYFFTAKYDGKTNIIYLEPYV